MAIMETAAFVGDKDEVKVGVRMLLPDHAKHPTVLVEVKVGEHPESEHTFLLYLNDLFTAYGIAEVLRNVLDEKKDEYMRLLEKCKREREEKNEQCECGVEGGK